MDRSEMNRNDFTGKSPKNVFSDLVRLGKTFFAICFLLIIITWRDCTHFSMNVGLILICVLELFASVIYSFAATTFAKVNSYSAKK